MKTVPQAFGQEPQTKISSIVNLFLFGLCFSTVGTTLFSLLRRTRRGRAWLYPRKIEGVARYQLIKSGDLATLFGWFGEAAYWSQNEYKFLERNGYDVRAALPLLFTATNFHHWSNLCTDTSLFEVFKDVL